MVLNIVFNEAFAVTSDKSTPETSATSFRIIAMTEGALPVATAVIFDSISFTKTSSFPPGALSCAAILSNGDVVDFDSLPCELRGVHGSPNSPHACCDDCASMDGSVLLLLLSLLLPLSLLSLFASSSSSVVYSVFFAVVAFFSFEDLL